MKAPKNFTPLFKEKTKGENQYLFKDNGWVLSSEDTIDYLWANWVVSENTHRYYDDEGYLVFGYLNKEVKEVDFDVLKAQHTEMKISLETALNFIIPDQLRKIIEGTLKSLK